MENKSQQAKRHLMKNSVVFYAGVDCIFYMQFILQFLFITHISQIFQSDGMNIINMC